MIQKTYYAHSENKAGQRHLLKEHLSGVAEKAQAYLQDWHAAEGHLAGLLHDLGKYGDLFQKRLDGKEKGVDHWSQGAGLALKTYQSLAAAWAIQGHHIGLQRLETIKSCADLEKLSQNHPLNLRLSAKDFSVLADRLKEDGLDAKKPASPIFTKKPQGRVDQMLDVRRLFSALVDADFIDTAAHFDGDQSGKQYRKPGQPLQAEKALSILKEELEKLASQSKSAESLNEIRNALKQSCLKQAQQKTGLFTLTAPTGSGKTLAMLAFALRHALQNKLERVIMVIPYLTIIEQTASIYQNLFEPAFGPEYVLEHHSMADFGKEEETEDSEGKSEENKLLRRKRLLAENWDAPIIVSTSVQCLHSLFSNRSSSCRKIHRLANAVILFDEVQTLPVSLAIPTLGALSHIATHWNSSVVFSTATQPAFSHLHDNVLKHATAGWSPQEIAKLPEESSKKLSRVRYSWNLEHPLSWQDLAEQMTQKPQALTIVNLKRHAKELFETLRQPFDQAQETSPSRGKFFHLSTNLCPAHRTAVLNQVRDRLQQNSECFLVATQCVEAGVDIDFPEVWRALAPLDAIIQAGGRCNREGKLASGTIHIFLPEENQYPEEAYKQAASVTQLHVKRYGENFDLYDPQVIQRYYKELYDVADIKNQNKSLQNAIKECDFPEVAHSYKLIPKKTLNILVPWQPQKALFDELKKAVADSEKLKQAWFRKARLLSVSLYPPKLEDPLWDSLIPIEGKQKKYNDWFLLAKEELYDEYLGLLPSDLNLWIA